MKKQLISIRKKLSKSFIKENEFNYSEYKDVHDYINKQAFPDRSDENIKLHKEFKLFFKRNPHKANLIRLIFVDLLILCQKK